MQKKKNLQRKTRVNEYTKKKNTVAKSITSPELDNNRETWDNTLMRGTSKPGMHLKKRKNEKKRKDEKKRNRPMRKMT